MTEKDIIKAIKKKEHECLISLLEAEIAYGINSRTAHIRRSKWAGIYELCKEFGITSE